jgi:hypothetical protein
MSTSKVRDFLMTKPLKLIVAKEKSSGEFYKEIMMMTA